MQYAVVELYENGLRRKREEFAAAAPSTGELTVGGWQGDPDKEPRFTVAKLTETYGATVTRNIFPPLFDPVLVRMTRSGFVLRGMQLASDGGVVREVVQEWWVRETTATDRNAAAFPGRTT